MKTTSNKWITRLIDACFLTMLVLACMGVMFIALIMWVAVTT